MPLSFHIPLHEIRFEFSRSGGKGGQNVNKVETRVQAFWKVDDSGVCTDEQKWLIKRKLSSHLNGRGELMAVASSERSQAQNKEAAVTRLTLLVRRGLAVPKKRKATKPTRASSERRLESKTLRSKVKKARKEKLFW